MPELPEVETTTRFLKKEVLGRTFIDVWTDSSQIIKRPASFAKFKKAIVGKRIQKIRRRAKNIIFDLSENSSLLIHQKLTGHLLLGRWEKKANKWQASSGPLSEKINTYIHLLFIFDRGPMLALSDLRKFAKLELWDTKELENSVPMQSLGPEPLSKSFTFQKFQKILRGRKGKIKQVLMDQQVLAGIGNIYSDEILWHARVHPSKEISRLSGEDPKNIYQAMRKILTLSIKLQGESISDYRVPSGEKGFFDKERKVYRREGERCSRCTALIKRVEIGGRSAHFCPDCQPLSY